MNNTCKLMYEKQAMNKNQFTFRPSNAQANVCALKNSWTCSMFEKNKRNNWMNKERENVFRFLSTEVRDTSLIIT